MVLERPPLFDGREFFWFLLGCLVVMVLSLGLEYRDYRELTRFNDAVVDAVVVHHYLKQKGKKQYSVLKLKTEEGAFFYTTGSKRLRHLTGYRLQLRLRTNKLGFWEYLGGFFVYSDILRVYPERQARAALAERIAGLHRNPEEGAVFSALFTASPMGRELRQKLSALGVSHLLAISGFHLGVLSFVLYMLLKPPMILLQSRWFPHRNRSRELFVVVAAVLYGYLAFLDYPPSLVRAFAMTAVGYLLYDRGIRVVSMQTLAVAVLLLAALWPRLLFSLGFWLSVLGVFFILLFVRHAPPWRKALLFVAVHLWVYLMMLPVSLWLFGTFSLWHPLSVLWSMLFIPFYPAALLAHAAGLEGVLEGSLAWLLAHGEASAVEIPGWLVLLELAGAAAAVYRPKALWLPVAVVLAVFVGAVYQVA